MLYYNEVTIVMQKKELIKKTKPSMHEMKFPKDQSRRVLRKKPRIFHLLTHIL